MVTPDLGSVVDSQTQLAVPKTKVYKYRWIILGLSLMASVLNGFQWIQYSIISNVVQKYYNVESIFVDGLSITFMLGYLPFNYPAMWLMERKGLKVVTVLSSLCLCLGAWIKVISVRPDLFYVTFIGQTVAGIGQVYTLNAPPKIAAVWFGQDQVSTACSIAVFGTQVGVLLGVVLPPIAVETHEEIDMIGNELSLMFYVTAGICSIHLMLIILFFSSEPELPPSTGQAIRVTETPALFDSMKRLSKNRGFVILVTSYGLITGISSAIVILFNQTFLKYYPGHVEDVGWIGLTMIIAGMFGSVVSGFVLDKTRQYKATALGLYLISAVGMLVFTFTLPTNLGVVYSVVAFLGFFTSAYFMVGYEFGVEITYPEPEGTTAGIVNSSAIIFSILLTLVASALINAVGDIWSNMTLAMTLFKGALLTALIKEDLKRQTAHALGEERD